MPLDFNKLGPPLFTAAIVAFFLYRRVRRNVGRQPLRIKSITFRIVLLAVLCAVVLLSPAVTVAALGYCAIGAILGAALGLYSLQHTKFEVTAAGKFYTPHLYIGLAVTALLISRVIYRLVQSQAAAQAAGQTDPNHLAVTFSSPLTLSFLFVTAGYYICFLAGVLLKTRQLSLPDGGSRVEPGK